MPRALDVCCGTRAFWFDKDNQDAVYCDIRDEIIKLPDRHITVHPDIQCDFRALPFPDKSFPLVIMDPPHTTHAGKHSWLRQKYGTLEKDWRSQLRDAFRECFRVLTPDGVLVFKWSEVEIPVREIAALSPVPPLIGHKSGKREKTHWLIFLNSPIFG